MRKLWPLFLFFLLLLAGPTACRQSAAQDSSIVISLEVESGSPAVGPSQLIATVHDADGTPIDNAAVELRGDMAHAGMQPVFATAAPSGGGVYLAPFEWTMGGDWFVTVEVTLPDGRTTMQEFPLTVSESS